MSPAPRFPRLAPWTFPPGVPTAPPPSTAIDPVVRLMPLAPPPIVIPAEAICIVPATQPPTSAIFALARRSSADVCISAATSSICSTCESRAARDNSESIIITQRRYAPEVDPDTLGHGPDRGGRQAIVDRPIRRRQFRRRSERHVHRGRGRPGRAHRLACVRFHLNLVRTGYTANLSHDNLLRFTFQKVRHYEKRRRYQLFVLAQSGAVPKTEVSDRSPDVAITCTTTPDRPGSPADRSTTPTTGRSIPRCARPRKKSVSCASRSRRPAQRIQTATGHGVPRFSRSSALSRSRSTLVAVAGTIVAVDRGDQSPELVRLQMACQGTGTWPCNLRNAERQVVASPACCFPL